MSESVERLLGEGAFPRELDRLNWGALVFGPWWALVHGEGRWFIGLLAAAIAPYAIGYLEGLASIDLVPFEALILGGWLVYVLCLGAFAFRANRLVWQRSADRQARGVTRAARPVARYLSAQRLWTAAAVLWVIALPVATLMFRPPDAGGPGFTELAFRYALSAVFVAVFLAIDKLRTARAREANKRFEPTP